MAVPDDIASKILADPEVKDWKPDVFSLKTPEQEKTTRAASGINAGDAMARFTKEIGSAGALGFTRGADFAKALVAGVAMPFIPESGKAGELAWKMLKPSEDMITPGMREAATNPQTFGGKLLAPAAEGIGGIASMPIPGGLARNVVAGMGMGEGAEIGKKVLGGIFNYFDPTAKKAGEQTGAILGGGAGSQLNVTRMNALGEGMRQAGGALGAFKPAFEAARAKKAAGDNRALWEIFADEFGNLRATTRGIIQNFTNANIAAAIRRDINASDMAQKFVDESKLTGMDQAPWGLGERTMVPAITRMVKERSPETFGEATEIKSRSDAMRNAIREAYDRAVTNAKLPINPDGMEGTAKAFQAITQAKVDALARQEGLVKQAFPSLSSSQQYAAGEAAREMRDNLARDSYAVANQKYGAAEALFDAEGVRIPSGSIRNEAKDILRDFYSQVDPTKVPPVVRNLLTATSKEAPEAVIVGRINSLDQPLVEMPTATEQAAALSKDLTLKETNDLARALNEAASNAKSSENFTAFNRAKSLEKELLDAIGKSPASDLAKTAYLEARKYWAEQHAPRFMEGMGKALGKERGGAFAGREAVRSEDVMNRFLADRETGMQDFDRIYGNNDVARQLLGKTVEDKFRKTVLDARTPEAMEKAYDAFRSDHAPVLERMPALADKMDTSMANMRVYQNERAMELDRYKGIMSSPLSQAVGPLQAKQMYQKALTDPLVMNGLINKTGDPKRLVQDLMEQAQPMKNRDYDPEALYALVQAGKNQPGSTSSLALLFDKAFGKVEGKKHLDTLEAIANFTAREAATNPQNLRAGSLINDQPVKSATGQTLASWISAWRAQEIGAAGSSYFAMLGLSRFANAKVQAAVERAKMKALYDPDTGKAILELAATPATEPIGMTTAKKIFGDIRTAGGQNLIDKLIDRGFVRAYVGRGMVYGEEKAKEEK